MGPILKVTDFMICRHANSGVSACLLSKAVLVGSLLFLSSCIGSRKDACCDPPAIAVGELVTIGVTLSIEEYPFPNSIGQRFLSHNSDSAVVGNVYLVFAPHPEYELIDNIGDLVNKPARIPYEYTFSELIDTEYFEIPYKSQYVKGDPDHHYYGLIQRVNDWSFNALGVSGNHVLEAWPSATIPVRATHVELWYREDAQSERSLVRRVSLESIYAWRTYYRPLIEQNQ